MTATHVVAHALNLDGSPSRSADQRVGAYLAATAGAVGIVGNLYAVWLLRSMPSAYRLAQLDAWVDAVQAQPFASTASSVSFTLGLLGIAWWAAYYGRHLSSAVARAAGALIACGAVVNAAGTLTPLVQALHVGSCGEACHAVGRALLGLSLSADALFNLALGGGLVMMSFSPALRGGFGLYVRLTGLVTMPVSAQLVWDPAASLLYLAAPLWLLAIAISSYRLLTAHES